MIKTYYEYSVDSYTYEVNDYDQKIEDTKTYQNSEVYDELHLFAEPGKVFRDKRTGEVLTDHICLGSGDSSANYEEVAIE